MLVTKRPWCILVTSMLTLQRIHIVFAAVHVPSGAGQQHI